MPTYQYRCTACAEDLEAVQSFTDPSLTDCPACGGSLRKVFGSVGVVFKGSGFYKTDSRSSAKNGAAAAKDRTKDSSSSADSASSTSSADSSTSSSSNTSGEKASSGASAASTSTSGAGSSSAASAA